MARHRKTEKVESFDEWMQHPERFVTRGELAQVLEQRDAQWSRLLELYERRVRTALQQAIDVMLEPARARGSKHADLIASSLIAYVSAEPDAIVDALDNYFGEMIPRIVEQHTGEGDGGSSSSAERAARAQLLAALRQGNAGVLRDTLARALSEDTPRDYASEPKPEEGDAEVTL